MSCLRTQGGLGSRSGVSPSPGPKPIHPRHSADTCLQRTPTLSTGHACVLSHFSRVQLFATLWIAPTRLLRPWNFPGKNTALGCHFLLQGIFLTQGLNPCLMSHALAGGFFTTRATWEARGLARKPFFQIWNAPIPGEPAVGGGGF